MSPSRSPVNPVSAPERKPRRIRGLDADERRAQRREALLEAALSLFAENGYAGTSIEQICQAAYVGTKGFYESFESKEQCYLELLADLTMRIKATMDEAWRSAPDDEDAATEHLVRAFARAITDDRRVALVTFGHARGISHTIESERRANRRYAAQFVVELWRRFDPAREAAAGDADVVHLALGLIGGLFELVADWILEADIDEAADREQLIAQLTAFAAVMRRGLLSSDGR